MLRGPDGDPRRHRRDRLVTKVLVDLLRCAPERLDVDPGVLPEPGERGRERLTRDPMEGQGDRIDGAGNEVGAGAHRLEGRRERVAGGALAVEPDRQPARLA